MAAAPRGNHVLLKGAASKVDQARRVLESLYTTLEEGRTVDIADVDAVIRMIETEDSQLTLPTLEKKGKVRMAQIATRKSTIIARTPAQDAYMRAMDRSELVFGVGPAVPARPIWRWPMPPRSSNGATSTASSSPARPSRPGSAWAFCPAT